MGQSKERYKAELYVCPTSNILQQLRITRQRVVCTLSVLDRARHCVVALDLHRIRAFNLSSFRIADPLYHPAKAIAHYKLSVTSGLCDIRIGSQGTLHVISSDVSPVYTVWKTDWSWDDIYTFMVRPWHISCCAAFFPGRRKEGSTAFFCVYTRDHRGYTYLCGCVSKFKGTENGNIGFFFSYFEHRVSCFHQSMCNCSLCPACECRARLCTTPVLSLSILLTSVPLVKCTKFPTTHLNIGFNSPNNSPVINALITSVSLWGEQLLLFH